jgi:hypothetical protein
MTQSTAQKAAIAAIEKQQPKNRGTVWCCGEQLKDICRREPDSAALILEDVTKDGHRIEDAEKEIRKFARGNGNAASPWEAEGVLRRFYGLPEQIEDGEPEGAPERSGEAQGKIIDLADFL